MFNFLPYSTRVSRVAQPLPLTLWESLQYPTWFWNEPKIKIDISPATQHLRTLFLVWWKTSCVGADIIILIFGSLQNHVYKYKKKHSHKVVIMSYVQHTSNTTPSREIGCVKMGRAVELWQSSYLFPSYLFVPARIYYFAYINPIEGLLKLIYAEISWGPIWFISTFFFCEKCNFYII